MRSTEPIDSLAVLPFVHVGSNPTTEYLSEGITESLITDLSRVRRLKIKSRDTVFRYNAQGKDVQAIGRDLGVRAVLKGRLVQRPDSLAISAELVDTRDGTLLWREQYERRVADILSIQREISNEISEQLRLKLTGEERRRLAIAPTRNPDAYQLYLQGRYWWNRLTHAGLMRSIGYFEKAIEKDPSYAQAWAGLADSFVLLGHNSLLPPGDAHVRARAAATRAIELNDGLAEAHAALAMVKTTYEWDWPTAEREHKRAIELQPDYGTARHWYAWHLVAVGRLPEAIAEIRRAQEVDPLSPYIAANAGQLYYYSRDYERAIEEARNAMNRDPTFARPHLVLGLAYALQGQQKDASAELNEALRLAQKGLIEVAYAGASFAVLGERRNAYNLLEELNELSQRQFVAPHLPGLLHASLGEKDEAFKYFEEALNERSVPPWMLRIPLLDGVRSDPRFLALLRRMKLTP